MKIESNIIYINGFLQPLESEQNKNYISYPYRMIPNHIKLKLYSVAIDGVEARFIDNNKLDILAQVDLFNNTIYSNNITDLFSFLDYNIEDNITTYTHYSTIKNLKYCPDNLGLLYLGERYSPLALHAISIKLYVDIYEKQTNLLNILSH